MFKEALRRDPSFARALAGLGEAYLDGKWLKLDATIDAATAAAKGRPYTHEFDGVHDIPTVEGPILKDLESHADYPPEVADWYEAVAREVVQTLRESDAAQRVASDDALWQGPDAQRRDG